MLSKIFIYIAIMILLQCNNNHQCIEINMMFVLNLESNTMYATLVDNLLFYM